MEHMHKQQRAEYRQQNTWSNVQRAKNREQQVGQALLKLVT
jgi:hypothetical protein